MNQDAIDLWASLPEQVRRDSLLASFQQEYEKIYGESIEYLVEK